LVTESKESEPKDNIMTPTKFSLSIENKVLQGDCTHMEAVLDYCEKNDLDPSHVKPLLTKSLKEKIEVNARQLNFLPRVAQLPI